MMLVRSLPELSSSRYHAMKYSGTRNQPPKNMQPRNTRRTVHGSTSRNFATPAHTPSHLAFSLSSWSGLLFLVMGGSPVGRFRIKDRFQRLDAVRHAVGNVQQLLQLT